jgi:hypothetical protein
VRSAGVATTVALGLLAAACSSGGASDGGSKDDVCALVARLDETAATIAKADVSDPGTFEQTLDDAVHDYVETVRDLRPLVPDHLHEDLDRLEAAVDQRDFTEALDARRALDGDPATACAPSTTTTTSD